MRNINILKDPGYQSPLVVYGERPMYEELPVNLILKHGRIQSAGKFTSDYLLYSPAEMHKEVKRAKKYYGGKGIGYYSPTDALCRAKDWCDILTPDNKVIYFDTKHFTLDGVDFLAPDFLEYLAEFSAKGKDTLKASK